jgi:hypothetical protein
MTARWIEEMAGQTEIGFWPRMILFLFDFLGTPVVGHRSPPEGTRWQKLEEQGSPLLLRLHVLLIAVPVTLAAAECVFL